MKKVRDRCGIFVKKERECGISTLSSPPPAPPFQTPIGVISSEMAEMVQAQQITAVYTTVRWSILLIKVNKSWAWERSKIY